MILSPKTRANQRSTQLLIETTRTLLVEKKEVKQAMSALPLVYEQILALLGEVYASAVVRERLVIPRPQRQSQKLVVATGAAGGIRSDAYFGSLAPAQLDFAKLTMSSWGYAGDSAEQRTSSEDNVLTGLKLGLRLGASQIKYVVGPEFKNVPAVVGFLRTPLDGPKLQKNFLHPPAGASLRARPLIVLRSAGERDVSSPVLLIYGLALAHEIYQMPILTGRFEQCQHQYVEELMSSVHIASIVERALYDCNDPVYHEHESLRLFTDTSTKLTMVAAGNKDRDYYQHVTQILVEAGLSPNK